MGLAETEVKSACGPLVAKLRQFTDFGEEDITAIEHLCRNETRQEAGRDLIREGDCPEQVFLLIEGWACRYKILPDGRRQIFAYLVPGDLCDIHVFILREMDHSIGLLTEARYAEINKNEMREVLHDRPVVSEALWWSTLVDEAVLREWLVNIGQRSAYERLAHLFLEIYYRMEATGEAPGRSFSFPVTQEQLADTMGLTPVHINRTLQRMRDEGMIELKSKRLKLLDVDQLCAVADFNDNYLHRERRAKR